MIFHRIRVLIVSVFIVGCCFASLPAYPGRIKNTPSPEFFLIKTSHWTSSPLGAWLLMPHSIRSKRHVSTHGAQHPAARSETNDGSFIYCQGEEQKTQFTLEAPPRMQTLEIEADAITRIENGARICHVSPGEES